MTARNNSLITDNCTVNNPRSQHCLDIGTLFSEAVGARKNRLIIGEISAKDLSVLEESEGGGILSPALPIRLAYFRDTEDGRQEWAAMTPEERNRLVWMATHGIQVDGTVYEVTNIDHELLRDLASL